MARRFLAGVSALLTLLVVIIGIPVILILVAGNPLPTLEQWQSIVSLQPDYGNEILLTTLLPLIAWGAWALFAGPWLWELLSHVAGRPARRQPTMFRGQQRIAVALIGAVLVMFTGGVGVLGTAAQAQAAETQRAAVHQVISEPELAAATGASVEQAQTPIEAQSSALEAVPEDHADLVGVVVPGDTLWGLAEKYLGDGANYPEIFQASAGIEQPDGRYMTDPDMIYPGDQVVIPDAGALITPPPPAPAPTDAAAEAPTISEAPSPDATAVTPDQQAPLAAPTPQVQQQGQDSIAPVPQRQQAPSSPNTADEGYDAEGSDFSIPLVTSLGLGGILAAGLLVALERRRLRQRRRRQSGERIAMPEPAAADYELELRMVENPNTTADLDNALRHLQIWAEDTNSPLPELLAVRVDGEEIALYLTGSAQLPAPFESVAPDGTAWVVRAGQSISLSRDAVSPYPALVTIGTDAQGGVILLDLEQIGSLNIAAVDEEIARGMLTAMSVELASNPWSEGTRVTLVGIPVTLAREVDRYRVQHVDDVAALVRNLRSDLDDRRAALDSYGATDVHDARAHAAEFETWAPHIVILAEQPGGELGAELAELVTRMPRLGIATIAHGATITAAATITVADTKHAEYISSSDSLPPLPFEPQLLIGRELELVQALFDTTEQESHPADLVTQNRIVELPDLPSDQITDQDAAEAQNPEAQTFEDDLSPDRWAIILPPNLTDRPTPESATADTTSVADEARPIDPPVEQQTPSTGNAETITDIEAATDAPEPDTDEPASTDAADDLDVTVPDWPAPYIRLLGPIDALNLTESDLPGRGIELLAYLALQSGPVPGAQIHKAMWPDKYDPTNNNLRNLAKLVRSALGNAPDGAPLLPEGRNNSGFTIHPAFRTDWDDFRDLIGSDLKTTSNENLIAALRLVRGAPFIGANRRRGWWAWRALGVEEEMLAHIIDAAGELGDRALRRGDHDQARSAAHVAQIADPLVEAGWRLELRAAMQVGDVEEFNRVIDDLYARVGGTDPSYEPDETTQQLIDTGSGLFGIQ